MRRDKPSFTLFIHELLIKSGCKVEHHPALKESRKKLDFLVTTKECDKFYLEAKLIGEFHNKSKDKEKQKNLLYDTINENFKNTSNSTLSINIISQSTGLPSYNNLHAEIESKISLLSKERPLV